MELLILLLLSTNYGIIGVLGKDSQPLAAPGLNSWGVKHYEEPRPFMWWQSWIQGAGDLRNAVKPGIFI